MRQQETTTRHYGVYEEEEVDKDNNNTTQSPRISIAVRQGGDLARKADGRLVIIRIFGMEVDFRMID